MKRPTLTRFGFICIVVLLFLIQLGFGKAQRFPNSLTARFQDDVTWIPFVPEGEEFAAMIPAPPTILNEPANYSYKENGERVLQHRDYGGYGNGLVFIIESYKAARAEKLWGTLLQANSDQNAIFEREISLDGVIARQYRSTYSSSYAKYTRHIVRFATKEHVYFLTLVALEETNPVVDQFLSTFRLRRPQDRITGAREPEVSGINPNDAFNSKDVARKAIIVWKPEPSYTEQARAHQLQGTVILEAIFAANGYVTNIKVIKEMKDGMTERAIEHTRNIRFFPAEKDGKRASQNMRLEYNFNLF